MGYWRMRRDAQWIVLEAAKKERIALDAVVFEKFTESDWENYMGCETLTPVIARSKYSDYNVEVVLEQCAVNAIIFFDAGKEDVPVYAKDFSSEEIAEHIARQCSAYPERIPILLDNCGSLG